ncbi:MAG: acyl-CoA thioesterase [Gammaproteobacteria bacterium CG_4_10_14_0_8_um_filter_38_16]|nr:MAG: acyl-CoA thioesterase [Gammaproteobacteria bacterium CG_4_10_14_0_8_um_filter_38_16]PJA04013.1 MAG: acyl-CoA thioesterase [Gammaproteobacteria bacterium CG_4_10_14_0_2_um_filter_38_22]PJB11025.1 MAG: acyl-CoA thioesterase [Gammaproteobacteria bacterium CG_4_9_14_3_um_filter_38_9]
MIPSDDADKKPCGGQLAIRTLAMPADTNVNGDIFGGWVISYMDLAGLSIARKRAKCRVTTVAIDKMVFLAPVHVGDFICCYGELLKVGRTSMAVRITTYATDELGENRRQVTEGIFTYVAIDENGKSIPVKSE